MINSAHRIAAIEPDLRRAIDAELDAGERIVWLRQPVPWMLWRGTLIVLIFGLPWTAFAIFWTLGAAGLVGSGARATGWWAWVFPMWGLPFIFIGLVMLSAPYWTARAARRTVYVITDRRAIVWIPKAWGEKEVQSFEPKRLLSITRTQRANGSGDLVFEQFRETRGSSTTTIRRGFMGLADVRDAETVLRETLLRAYEERTKSLSGRREVLT
jgi:hypothetical protein